MYPFMFTTLKSIPMKRQPTLALCALLVLSACKAPVVISGNEYNPSAPAAAKATPEPSAPVATAYAIQDNSQMNTAKPATTTAASPSNTTSPTAAATMTENIAMPKVPNFAPESPAADTSGKPAKIEKVPFRLGTSSVTVEKMAKQNQCESNTGAGLLARNGPIEVYRVECTDGKVFMARCDMRQCGAMSTTQSNQ